MDWQDLTRRLEGCSGGDADLDAAVAEAFAVPPAHYTGSVEACRDLVARALPGWRLHLGFDVTGVFPYAALSRGPHHLESEAAAIPLAILKAAVAAVSLPPEPPSAGP